MEDNFEKLLKRVRVGMASFSLGVITLLCREDAFKEIMQKNPNSYYENIYNGNQLILKPEEKEKIKIQLEKELDESIFLSHIDESEIENYFLLNAVLKNPNLNNDEKRYLYHLIDMIIENPYLDKEHSYESLNNLKYVYKQNDKSFSREEGKVTARHNPLEDIIELYDLDVKETAICHENVHALFDHEKWIKKLPHFFEEGMSELLNREYLGSDPFSVFSAEINDSDFVYLPQITAVKLLCELVGSDKVLEAYTKEDMSIIYQELAKIKGSKIGAMKFIQDLNYITKKVKTNDYLNYEEDKRFFEKIEGYKNGLVKNNDKLSIEFINYYLNMLKCFYTSGFYGDKIMNYIEENGIVEKAYFSEMLKGEAKNSIIPYYDRLCYYNGRLYENIFSREKIKMYQ